MLHTITCPLEIHKDGESGLFVELGAIEMAQSKELVLGGQTADNIQPGKQP